MNRLAFLSLYRSFARQRAVTALNILGLAVGVAVFLVLALYVRFETSFERWLPDHEQVYVVQTVWDTPGSPHNGPYNDTMGGLLDQLRQDFPGTIGTRILGGENGGIVRQGQVSVTDDVAMVDARFPALFDLPMVRGAVAGVLDQPDAVLISRAAARRYFGSGDPIGQMLTISVFAAQNYRVAGVFEDLPANSDLKLSLLIRLPGDIGRTNPNWYHWGSTSLPTFLRFPSRAAARDYAAALPAFVDRRGRADLGDGASDMVALALLPLTDLHLQPEGSASASARLTLIALGLVGLLTLLIALVNYVNLATARASLRAREVAMRKVLGADRAAIIKQFLGEAVLTVALATLAGLILAELGLPLINAASGLALTIPYAIIAPALVGLIGVTGLLAGSYPALLLSGYRPAAVLASSRAPGGGRAGARIREGLVVFQFALVIALLIGTTVLVSQTRHMRSADVGFQREGLLTVLSTRDSLVAPAQKRAFMARLRALPSVRAAAFANSTVGGSGERNADTVALPGVPGSGPSLVWESVGPDFFTVYGTRLLAGRVFDSARAGDDGTNRAPDATINIVINRQAVRRLGFATARDAVGKTIGGARPLTIIGVVDDMRFYSPREPLEPTYYRYAADPAELLTTVASVRFSGDPRAALRSISDLWQSIVPQVPFDAQTADARLTEFYRADDRATRLFAIGAGLAVLIGCVGLWGLASFNTARRVKEIGIRKSLGASSGDVVTLLIGQFLRPVLLANLIAWPLAYLVLRTWLAGFSDRIALSPLYFLGGSLLAIAIAVLTVLGQSLRASRTTPAWALRHD